MQIQMTQKGKNGKAVKRWNLGEIEMSGGKREARNVGRAIAEQRVEVEMVSSWVEFGYEVRCVPRHIQIRSITHTEILMKMKVIVCV